MRLNRALGSGHAGVWRLAGPMILSNVSVALLGLVDTAVVGHLSASYYLGAVAVGSILFNFLYWSMAFLRMGTTGIVAQVHGSGDVDRMRASLLQSLLLSGVIASFILLLRDPIADFGLKLLNGSEDVVFHARRYFDTKVWGAPATLGLYAVTGWFIGMQNTRAALIVAVTINLLNVSLDLLFVVVFGMDVQGVALASVIAEYVGLSLVLYLAYRVLRGYAGGWRRELIWDRRAFLRMLALNRNIFIRTLCLIFVFAFVTQQGARQGDVILAANAILLNLQFLMALALDGFANAAEALVGKSIGAKDEKGFKQAVTINGFWCLLVALLFTIAYAAAGDRIIGMLTDIENVRDTASLYLVWMIVSPIISAWSFLLDGVFIGATRAAEMRNSMLVSTLVFFLPAWYVLQPLGNHGLWLAFLIFMAGRGLTMSLLYLNIQRAGGFVCTLAFRTKSGL